MNLFEDPEFCHILIEDIISVFQKPNSEEIIAISLIT